MEVHKHPRDVTHKKKWGEYFLEFLMIFLAVFLGFLAENFRENFVERRREKQFLASLLNDLKVDVKLCNANIDFRLKRVQYCDSLLFLLTGSSIRDRGADIYYYARSIFIGRFPFTSSSGGFEQLKSSGNLRLIRNADLVDSLEKYYLRVKVLESNEQVESSQITEYREVQSDIFQAKVFLTMFDSSFESTVIHRPSGNPQLLTYDPGPINKLCMKLHFWERNAKGVYLSLKNTNRSAENLISMIQREYHLK